MSERGDWFRLHRKWLDCAALHDHAARGWWASFLTHARWADSTFRGHAIAAGEFGCSLRLLAERERVERNTLRHWLRHFASHRMLTVRQVGEGRRKITIVKILNWQRYQLLVGEPTNPQSRLVGQSANPQANPQADPQADPQNKNIEEGKELFCRSDCDEPVARKTKTEYPAAFEAFWQAYPKRDGRRHGKEDALKCWKRIPAAERPLVHQAAEAFARSRQALDNKARDAERFLSKNWWRGWLEPADAAGQPSQYRELKPCNGVPQP